MTPRITKLAALYLLLGLVTTIVVAWVCGTIAEFDDTRATVGSRIASPAETGGPPAYAALHRFTAPGATFYSSVMFFDRDSVAPGWPTPEDLATGWARRAVIPRFHASLSESHRPTFGRVQIEAVGWPRRALWCEYVAHVRAGASLQRAEGALVLRDAAARRPMHGGRFPLVLALRPLPGGLIADTLFYAAVLAGLHQLPALSRRWLRRRRGLCPTCAYDLTGITGPCPECGRTRDRNAGRPPLRPPADGRSTDQPRQGTDRRWEHTRGKSSQSPGRPGSSVRQPANPLRAPTGRPESRRARSLAATRRYPASVARRIVIYVAAVALLLSTAIFAISLFGASWVGSGPQPFQIHLEWGLAEMNNSESYGRRGWNALAFDWPRAWWPRSSFYYHVRERSGVVSWGVSIPLWMPVAAAGAALVPALVLERRARALAKVGRCPACGYDVAGITGPCPECGNKERERTI